MCWQIVDEGDFSMQRTLPIFALSIMSASLFLASSEARAAPVQFSCSGPKVDAARKVAKENGLKPGTDPKACFGEFQLTESARKQIVVALPAADCKRGKLLNVYDRSRAGPWYALFKQPVCGSSISVGPKSPYGDNMITVDGRHYLEKGGDFVPLK
jgi:hypothetical protein